VAPTWPHSGSADCLVGCRFAHFRRQAVDDDYGAGWEALAKLFSQGKQIPLT